MNNSCSLNIKFNLFPIWKKTHASTSNVNLKQFSLLNILHLFSFFTFFIILTLIAIIHLFQVSCFLSSLVGQLPGKSFFHRPIFVMYYIVVLFVVHVNHVALKIFFEYSRKIKQDSSMTQSPTNLVPRVSQSSDSFDSTDSVFFSTIKTIGKKSLLQMIDTATHIYSSY